MPPYFTTTFILGVEVLEGVEVEVEGVAVEGVEVVEGEISEEEA